MSSIFLPDLTARRIKKTKREVFWLIVKIIITLTIMILICEGT